VDHGRGERNPTRLLSGQRRGGGGGKLARKRRAHLAPGNKLAKKEKARPAHGRDLARERGRVGAKTRVVATDNAEEKLTEREGDPKVFSRGTD